MQVVTVRWQLLGGFAIGMLCSLIACGGGSGGNSDGSSTANPPQFSGYYGSSINADDIANIVVGWNPNNDICNRMTSYRIRATHTGKLKSIRPFFIWSDTKPGYNLGDGGHIQIQIQSDDGTGNHFPSGTTLASFVYDHPVLAGNHFPLLTFSTPAELIAGQLYHVVFTNKDSTPKVNWVSLDCLWMWDACSPEQPTTSNTDMAILERCEESTAWVLYKRGQGNSITPIIELDYEDGASQGQGYIQGYGAPSTSWGNPKQISGTQAVQEVLTVSGFDRIVSSVSVRVNRTSGASPLTIRVEKENGTVIGQGTVLVDKGLVNFTGSDIHNGSSWAKLTFTTPLTLLAGLNYHLVLSSPTDTIHTAHALQKGISYGYSPTTYFADGHAEFMAGDGTGWKLWNIWGISGSYADLQFYFETHQ